MRHQDGIVSCSGTYLDNGFAFAESQHIEPVRVRAWLADVDPALRIQGYERVLIDKSRIIIWRADITDSGNADGPGAWSDKALAIHGGERLFNPAPPIGQILSYART